MQKSFLRGRLSTSNLKPPQNTPFISTPGAFRSAAAPVFLSFPLWKKTFPALYQDRKNREFSFPQAISPFSFIPHNEQLRGIQKKTEKKNLFSPDVCRRFGSAAKYPFPDGGQNSPADILDRKDIIFIKTSPKPKKQGKDRPSRIIKRWTFRFFPILFL